MARLGVLRYLEGRKENRAFLFLRSIFSIWDPEDLVNLDLPWWTFEATRVVDGYLRSLHGRAVVFEYGGGASTAWLAKRCAKVYSLDHDPKWTRLTAKLCETSTNVTFLTRPPDPDSEHTDERFSSGKVGYRGLTFKSYVDSIRSVNRRFDMIVIDGRCRSESLLAAVPAIKETGIIVFDDSSRKRYQRTLRESGLELKRHRGLTPGAPIRTETSILAPSSDTLEHLCEIAN